MNAPTGIERPLAIGVALVESAADLRAIRRLGVAAALWNRGLPDEMVAWLDGLTPETMPDGRVEIPASKARAAVQALLHAAGSPPGAGRDLFAEDVAALARAFAVVAGAPFLSMRLQAVMSNACRRFHIDVVEQRLVCTYRGPGTQYAVVDGATEPTAISEVATGAPIVMRGKLWPGDAPSGLRHRSPPIEGTGVARLVLVLDPLDRLTDDADAL